MGPIRVVLAVVLRTGKEVRQFLCYGLAFMILMNRLNIWMAR